MPPTPTASSRSSTAATRAARRSSPPTRPSPNGPRPSATKHSPPRSSTASCTTLRCPRSTALPTGSRADSTHSGAPHSTTPKTPNDAIGSPSGPIHKPSERLTAARSPPRSRQIDVEATSPARWGRATSTTDRLRSPQIASQRPRPRPTTGIFRWRSTDILPRLLTVRLRDLKRQMGLQDHLAKTLPGLVARIAQRLLALTLGIYLNILLGRPARALAAYDGR